MWLRLYRGLADCIDLLLPPACLLCGCSLTARPLRQAFCDNCCAGIVPLPAAHCLRCAQPFPKASSSHLCGACLLRPPGFSIAHAAGLYQGGTKEAIHKLKYRNQLPLAQPLGRMLADTVTTRMASFAPDFIVPVPLHIKRLRQRGYNQALEISRPLSRQLQVPINTMILQRIRNTPQQQGLTAEDRRKNLRHAFALGAEASSLRILLVDDVMTTGETLRECSRLLISGSAAEVQVAVVGRA